MEDGTETKAQIPVTLDLAAMLPEVTRSVAAQMRERVSQQIGYSLQTAVHGEVERYLKEHVVPDVQKTLVENHAELVATMVAAVKLSAMKSAEAMVAMTEKKIAGYEGEKFLRDLFKTIAADKHY